MHFEFGLPQKCLAQGFVGRDASRYNDFLHLVLPCCIHRFGKERIHHRSLETGCQVFDGQGLVFFFQFSYNPQDCGLDSAEGEIPGTLQARPRESKGFWVANNGDFLN